MFYDCPKVKELWITIEQWLQQKYKHIQLDKDMVLFGSINIKHEFVNWIIVNVKFYIYRTKLQKKILNKIGIKNTYR